MQHVLETKRVAELAIGRRILKGLKGKWNIRGRTEGGRGGGWKPDLTAAMRDNVSKVNIKKFSRGSRE